jgi:PIN domain nuclease of toxin-antitoxin system
MRLLIDTHVALALAQRTLPRRFPQIARHLGESDAACYVSVASLWEIAIKARLGKLDPGMPLEDIAGVLEAARLIIISIEAAHAIASIDPEPETRDPFDRLLLAQCQVENMKLVTVDRALFKHPLALTV